VLFDHVKTTARVRTSLAEDTSVTVLLPSREITAKPVPVLTVLLPIIFTRRKHASSYSK